MHVFFPANIFSIPLYCLTLVTLHCTYVIVYSWQWHLLRSINTDHLELLMTFNYLLKEMTSLAIYWQEIKYVCRICLHIIISINWVTAFYEVFVISNSNQYTYYHHCLSLELFAMMLLYSRQPQDCFSAIKNWSFNLFSW